MIRAFSIATKVHIDPTQNVVPIAAAVAPTNAVPFEVAATQAQCALRYYGLCKVGFVGFDLLAVSVDFRPTKREPKFNFNTF